MSAGAWRGDGEPASVPLRMCDSDSRIRSNMTGPWAAKKVSDRRRIAAIGHMQHVDAGHHLEQLAGKMRRRADAAGRHIDLARMRLGIGDQLRHAVHRQRRIDLENKRIEIDAADRREIAGEIEAQVWVQHGVDDVRIRHRQQRVAVRLRLHHGFGGDLLARRTAIFDDEGLAEPLRQHLPGEPSDDVGGPARRETDQQMNRS